MRLVSPKILARSIGVSESSLKRWSDKGLLNVSRTAGGHRRITISEAVRFIRAVGAEVVRPDLLGLHEVALLPPNWRTDGNVSAALVEALTEGRAVEARAMVQSLYLAGWKPAAIFDGPLRSAMAEIGSLWLHAEWGIVVEHRATDLCVQAVSQLRLLSPNRGPNAPVAVGSGGEHDPYALPSLMAATVVGDLGMLDVNLGALTPTGVVANAARHYNARLVWQSISHTRDLACTLADLRSLAAEMASLGARVVAGGRALADLQPADLPGVCLVRSMAELESFASPPLGAQQ